MTALLLAANLLAGVNVVRERLAVEYAEVEGSRCLQPRLLREDATLDDLRAAEKRWVDEKYPGRPVRRWQTVLSLGPGVKSEFDPGPATIHTDSAWVELPDGSLRELCFEINRMTG